VQIRVSSSQPWDVPADVLAVPISPDGDGSTTSNDGLAELDRRMDGALGEYRRVGELTGKAYGSALLRGNGFPADWLLGMGIGKREGFDRVQAVRFGAAIERRLAGRSVRRVAVVLPEVDRVPQPELVELVVRVAEMLGRKIATPADARRMLGLNAEPSSYPVAERAERT
jgi:hypothetical protein